MVVEHPLLGEPVVRAIERAVSAHLGRRWVCHGFTDLSERASHPSGVLHGESFSVFAKLGGAPDAHARFTAELRGLNLLAGSAAVRTPTAVAAGVVDCGTSSLLLLEALTEQPAGERGSAEWASIGQALATVHRVTGDRFGLDEDGFFGPLPQDNRPVPSNRWADFYVERRIAPLLRRAAQSGHLPVDLALGVERVADRMSRLCGPEPRPTLLHGDAQQNNILTTSAGAVFVDPAPYFGHPEIDLALVDYFQPVPDTVFDAYRELVPIDDGFGERRELWRLFAHLAVVTVAGHQDLGRRHLRRIADVVTRHG